MPKGVGEQMFNVHCFPVETQQGNAFIGYLSTSHADKDLRVSIVFDLLRIADVQILQIHESEYSGNLGYHN